MQPPSAAAPRGSVDGSHAIGSPLDAAAMSLLTVYSEHFRISAVALHTAVLRVYCQVRVRSLAPHAGRAVTFRDH